MGKERKWLTRAIVVSLRELMTQTEPNQTTRDIAAFIGLALNGVSATIERTVAPWEKRDYWVKADKFRLEWEWVDQVGERMRKAAVEKDWGEVALLSAKVGLKLSKIEVSTRHRMGKPWVGAWDELAKQAGMEPLKRDK